MEMSTVECNGTGQQNEKEAKDEYIKQKQGQESEEQAFFYVGSKVITVRTDRRESTTVCHVSMDTTSAWTLCMACRKRQCVNA
jgi:hypothetical protein